MITAVDTNVLIDLRLGDPVARKTIVSLGARDRFLICEAVYAELCAGIDPNETSRFLDDLRIELHPSGREALGTAGQCWAAYREGGGSRKRVLADFLVGAHALAHADRLLTRDRGFYRNYFKQLKVIEPEV